MMRSTWLLSLLALNCCLNPARADDWPQWFGPQRDGVWRESGVLETFPEGGPTVLWRVPIQGGYSGPSVAKERVFVMDRPGARAPQGTNTGPAAPKSERVLCLDFNSGKTLWEHSYPCPYDIAYTAGPRTTPTVAGRRVYTLGAMGDLLCLDAADGRVQWSRNFMRDFKLKKPPVWGWAGHPLLDGDRLICTVGGDGSAVVAFDKNTGKEVWRALTAEEIGYAPPVIYEIAGRRQLIIWQPDAVAALDPENGKVLWTHVYPVEGKPQRPEVTIAMPRVDRDRLFLTSFYQGSTLLEVGADSAKLVWNRRSSSDSEMNDGLHTVLGTPVFKNGYIYGVCGFGELRCLDAQTGDRKWETYAATAGKKAFFGNAFLIPNGERTFLWNDQGELILARLRPDGYEEISRAKLLEPLEKTRGRTVLWCHPAFANRCATMHNGKELICVSLAAEKKAAPARAS